MDEKNKILLPEGFREALLMPCLSVRNAREILSDYCASCIKKPSCNSYQGLAHSLEKGYDYWSNSFKAVDVNLNPNIPFCVIKRVFCADYKNSPPGLQGISRDFCDGIERLLEILKEEKESFER